MAGRWNPDLQYGWWCPRMPLCNLVQEQWRPLIMPSQQYDVLLSYIWQWGVVNYLWYQSKGKQWLILVRYWDEHCRCINPCGIPIFVINMTANNNSGENRHPMKAVSFGNSIIFEGWCELKPVALFSKNSSSVRNDT